MLQKRITTAGFTLIEVLIASTLLFLVIGIASVAFEQLIHTKKRIVDTAHAYQVVPLIKETIVNQIEQNHLAQHFQITKLPYMKNQNMSSTTPD